MTGNGILQIALFFVVHQQDGERDGHHRHDGGGDSRQNDLGDLRVGVRGE